MTISRATEEKVVNRWSKPGPGFGMKNQQQEREPFSISPNPDDAGRLDFDKVKSGSCACVVDDAFTPSTNMSDLNVLRRPRNSRGSDYPKATLIKKSLCDQNGRDGNYFSDNFVDIPNPIPTGPSASSNRGLNTVISNAVLIRTTSIASTGSDNEAFSDEAEGSEPKSGLCDYSKSAASPSPSVVGETDQDIRRLTLASDSINPSHTSEQDFDSLLSNIERLRESGWFYENISRHQAKQLLRNKSMGAFIIRESTDPKHLFSLSVRTQRGTTSARIEYTNGRFRLDCEDSIRHHMPVFSCVVKLVNFYIKMGQKGNKPNPCVWLESTGRRDMPVRLSLPVRKELPSLRHFSRLAIANAVTDTRVHDSLFPNQETKKLTKLPLPNPLIRYLQSYPYPY
ncbi:uncharacterized protein LOC135489554 [Lineus longissimus]|uniref:uncharacterized protein LOC135489554 n=1 Tax=Lineus longissimus TaxID=88925 RepID=UPI00315C576B